jgi:hypothetical protein
MTKTNEIMPLCEEIRAKLNQLYALMPTAPARLIVCEARFRVERIQTCFEEVKDEPTKTKT